jgi:tetratricopeptide (TPR) repeat protein
MLWLRGRARTAELPEVDWDRLQMVAAVVVAMVAVSTLAVLIGVAVTSGRGRPLVVQAWTLPTRVPDATPTPSPSELAAPLIQEADAAIVNGDWKTAVELLGQAHKLDRRDAETRDRLAEACYEYGCALVDENRLEEAQVELDWAIRLDATNDELQHMRRQLKLYREAIDAYWAQDWQEVIDALQKVQKMAPEFRDTSSMLAESYVQRAMELQEAESYDEALEMYDLALEINPDMAEASARIAEVQEILVPAHRIEVDLSEQKVWVYEEHQVIREFIVCTGREGAPTKPGRYTILDKMPMAYASKWDLDMPWWLGIYWAGGSQNGFHALPYLSNGQILWRGYLGTRCSFGCIVLDTDDAKWLYDWAEEGDVVIVRR